MIAAGLLETGFAVCLIAATDSAASAHVLFAVFALASFGLLTLALKHREVGPAHAAWTGIGAAETVIAGIVGLHLTGGAH